MQLNSRVEILSMWIEDFNDYLGILSSSHLGLSFHVSTSGIDFPMKIVDMISVGLPVCSIYFQQLMHHPNILTFNSSKQLMNIIVTKLPSISKSTYNGPFWEEESKKIISAINVY